MLTVFGSTALDTIRTPTKLLKDVLGGAATFASISASFFVKPGLIAVVGKDFPKKYHKILAKRLDLKGLSINDGKTFRYSGSYDKTLSLRTTLRTDLNVLKNFKKYGTVLFYLIQVMMIIGLHKFFKFLTMHKKLNLLHI